MAKKLLLETRSEPAFFTLVGISSPLKDYRLSYLMNLSLESGLKKIDDFVTILSGKKETDTFSLFYHRDEDQRNSYFLLSNRNQENFLLPEMRQMDFLLIIEGEFKKARKESLLKNIRNIQNVIASYEIRFSDLKNIENLLMDLELHMMKILKPSKLKYKIN
jgi:hypothetical protein